MEESKRKELYEKLYDILNGESLLEIMEVLVLIIGQVILAVDLAVDNDTFSKEEILEKFKCAIIKYWNNTNKNLH